MVDVTQIGKVSAKKQAAASIAVGVATAGTVLVALRPRAFFFVLTNERLLLIDNNRGSVGKTVTGSIPRNVINAGPLRTGLLTYKMDVAIDGTPHRFSWGRIQGKTAKRVAAALGAPDSH
jgi:hypothetical protein